MSSTNIHRQEKGGTQHWERWRDGERERERERQEIAAAKVLHLCKGL